MRHQKSSHSKPFTPSQGGKQRAPRRRAETEGIVLFGIHAVEAALANPNRPVLRLHATENAAQRLKPLIAKRKLRVDPVTPKDLDRLLGPDTVHQGVTLEAGPLPPLTLDDVDLDGILLVLDQVTDPHNVGAALRSAAAFGASGLVLTERHSPPFSGVLAKNLSQALHELGERGVMRIGLAEEADIALEDAPLTRPLTLVLGTEGKGLRHLTREKCDHLCRISTVSALASLNVSNAAAIAMHWAAMKAQPA